MDDEFTVLGNLAMYEQSGSPQYHDDASGGSITRVFRGPMNLLLANRPKVGSTTTSNGYYLVSSDCRAIGPNALGELTLVYSNSTDGTILFGREETFVEVDWSQIEKPLATHSEYKNLDSAALKKIDDAIEGKIDSSELSPLESDFFKKKMKGVDSYIVFAPVIRKTSKSRVRPSTGSCGKISSPPIGVGSFEFLKTADSAKKSSRTNVWERTEEWTGADEWDHDIYQ